MTDDPTRSNDAAGSTGGGRVACPVCGVEGDATGAGLRNHLVYEHGWDEERVPAAPPTTPSASGSEYGTTD